MVGFFDPVLFSRKAEFRGFGAICGGLSTRRDLIIRACTSRETGPFVAFPLFRGGDLTFRVYGVDYIAFLKNYPIPQEVKGMADGDSLRQPFFWIELWESRVC